MMENGFASNEIIEINADRGLFYRMLSSLLWRELTEEQILNFRDAHINAEDLANDSMARGWRLIVSYLREFNSGTRQELAVDYAHTFLAAGNNDDRMAIPFESVFMSESGLLMQEPRDEVCKAYYAEHMAPSESLHTPEDHMAFELEFMAHLALRQIDALKADDMQEVRRLTDAQRSFFECHIANWSGVFCDAIERSCQTDFYRGVASLLRGWVEFDSHLLESIAASVLLTRQAE